MLGRFLAILQLGDYMDFPVISFPIGKTCQDFRIYPGFPSVLPWFTMDFSKFSWPLVNPWTAPRPRSGLGKKPAASARSEKMTDPSRRKNLRFFFDAWGIGQRWTKTSMGEFWLNILWGIYRQQENLGIMLSVLGLWSIKNEGFDEEIDGDITWEWWCVDVGWWWVLSLALHRYSRCWCLDMSTRIPRKS